MEKTRKKVNLKWISRSSVILFCDIIIILAAYLAALYIRFEFRFDAIPIKYLDGYIWSMPFWIIATIVVFYGFRLYHSIWSFASIVELQRMVAAYFTLFLVYIIGIIFMDLHMPRSYYFMGFVLACCLHTGIRFSYRFIRLWKKRQHGLDAINRIMVIGAGAAGQVIIKELRDSLSMNSRVICAIDDNPSKKGRMIEGVPIVGNRHTIIANVEEHNITEIIYAIPAAKTEDRREILNICKESGCKLQALPGVYQLINGEVSISKLKDVELEDLLGRDTVNVNNDEISEIICGKTIMVTGGGGSIGSELCRQISAAGPKKLIVFEIYENSAFDIMNELKEAYPDIDTAILIGSVRNEERLKSVMCEYSPDIVFHAAAHKHVPLMEDSPNEAIKNNVLGTYKTAVAAAEAGVDKFILISTDKAVNPTNIMGASKRLCEMVVQMMDRKYDTDFVAVRFGNVLGSNGSVVPLFKKQIASGGPVTVTDKRIIRYFMTISEAVSLVLQAACYAKDGEIFVLDMGEPVKIDDMARNLIRLSGYTPDIDIMIEYIGLRPGEKLYEELLMDEEGLRATDNELIFIGSPMNMDDDIFVEQLEQLKEACENESENIKELVSKIVPTYKYINKMY